MRTAMTTWGWIGPLVLTVLAAIPPSRADALDAAKAGQSPELPADVRNSVPRVLPPEPLWPAGIPDEIPGPDEESVSSPFGVEMVTQVSRPTYQAFLPPRDRNSHTAVLIFPGGAYAALNLEYEGRKVAAELIDRGVAAIVVKYRLPSSRTMSDRAAGPLLDAEQAVRVVRAHAQEWVIDPHRVGVLGFSAGGHLAAAVSTLAAADARPDFAVLIYPVISMQDPLRSHLVTRALLGPSPTQKAVEHYSVELHVTEQTPPTLLMAASDDQMVDVDNSVRYYEALRRAHVPAELLIFAHGGHGFFRLSRQDWHQPLWAWLARENWANSR